MGKVLLPGEEEKNVIEGIYDEFFEIRPIQIGNSNKYKLPLDVLKNKHHKARKLFFKSLEV